MKVKALIAISLIALTTYASAENEQHSKHRTKAYGETISKTFDVKKNESLRVGISGGDILVKTWEKLQVSVQAEGIDPDDIERLSITQNQTGVAVRFRGEYSDWSNFIIQVPSDFEVDLQTSGGDLELQGTYRGHVEGSTSGGDIVLGDVQGNVSLRTSGGDIRAGKIVGTVTLHTSGGDIAVKDCSGEVDVSTSGGDIDLGNVGKSLTARTSGGNITIGDVGGEARVSTAGGDIHVGKVTGNATMETAGGDIVLQSANGPVRASTAGGDVELHNITGSIDAKTAGGDIVAELRPSGTGTSRLRSAGGELMLYVPANAKATIEAFIEVNGRWKYNSEEYTIQSDFKADSYEKDEERKEIHAVYTLNGGGESITLETVNSNIVIRTLR